jgi:hypothetical protein
MNDATDSPGHALGVTKKGDTMCTARFVILASLIVGACGCSSDTEAATNPPTLEEVTLAMSQQLRTLNGSELSAPTLHAPIGGSSVTLEVVGFGFCLPTDTSASPATTPVVPNNAYGCQNALELGSSPSGTSVDFALTIPTLFIDLTGNHETLPAKLDGYATCRLETRVTAILIAAQDGTYTLTSSSLPDVETTADSMHFGLENSTLSPLANSLAGLVQPHIVSSFDVFLAERMRSMFEGAGAFVLE